MSTPCFQNADCGACPLSRSRDGFRPVPTERHDGDLIGVLGDFPGQQDTETGRPLVGTIGLEFQEALDALKIPRNKLRIANVLACRPPANDLGAVLRLTKASNKKAQKNGGTAKWKLPQDACRPRWMSDLAGVKYVLALGPLAASALRGGAVSIESLRGSCEEIAAPWDASERIKVGYTVHPSRVYIDPLYRDVFRRDIGKSFRYFFNRLRWTDPAIRIADTVDEVARGLADLRAAGEPVAYDCETDGRDPLNSKLRCIAFANKRLSVLIPILSIDGHTRIFDYQDEATVRGMVRDTLANPPFKLSGQNAGQFDRLLCEQQFGVTPKLSEDTILLHLLADNEMSHGLAFLGSFYTDFIEAWKADRPAENARTDMDLWTYCAKDACVTEHIREPIWAQVKARKQEHLFPRERRLQHLGACMQRMGLRVDLDGVKERAAKTTETLAKHEAICKSIAGKDFNTRSFPQVGTQLFEKFRLAPVAYSEETGEASTDDDSLRRMLIQYNLTEEQRAFIEGVRNVRAASKLLGTYLLPLRPLNRTYQTPSGEKRPGIVGLDGRIHPSYNRLPATGRYSSSNPNAQNIPAHLRDLFIPEDGHVFVACDADQLEARYIAEEAQAMRMCAVFNDGLDLHNETMEIIYGKGIWTLEGAPDDRRKKGKLTFKSTRDITKNVRYAWQYAAGIKRIWEQVTSVEDDTGKLLFAHLTQDDVREVVDGLRSADPEIPRWWGEIQLSLRRNGYIADRLWGRRRDFRGAPSINEQVNHPIQSGGFHMVAEALLELVLGREDWFATHAVGPAPDFDPALLRFNFKARTGLITQTHDSLMFEVPAERGEEAQAALTWAMTRRAKVGALLTYTAEGKTGTNWKDV